MKDRPYGCFRIEAWLEREGKAVSAVNELLVYRLRRPVNWGKDAPDSPFGIHTLSAARHIKMAKAAGANWTRLHDAGLEYIGWWMLEREKGKWTFFDKEINRYRDGRLMVFGELGTAPKWWGVSYDHSKKDLCYGYRTSKEPQKDFATLMKSAYVSARKVNPEAYVLGFNSRTGGDGGGLMSGSKWTAGVLDNGGLDA